jgi:hypothetical protein
MKVKTSELVGSALTWVVAKCEGTSTDIASYAEKPRWIRCTDESGVQSVCPEFHSYWMFGGPIIDREHIDLYYSTKDKTWAAAIWVDIPGGGQLEHKQVSCPTALVAAMRCFVTSKLGDEVEIPEELA